MKRVLEPEVMDTWEDATAYDAMDFVEVNTAFAETAIALGPESAVVLDAGTGTARIPILIVQRRPQWHIRAIDLSHNMLKVGRENVQSARVQDQIQLEYIDAKQMPYGDSTFDIVISNSIIHHLPDPMPFFRELKRVLKPNGGIFLRDLMRPSDIETVDKILARIGPEYNDYQTQLFRDSLIAAFTLEDVENMIEMAGLEGMKVYASSDRHWTAERAYRE
ncbi:class I SAM-dependent methyltransferase [Phormidium pseudopriestleyi FRX01]|uniref:Class I SAM-dependent methyltransferase n=1 Tax=Phormidium pseudopriestleyi FRX01 TaxID=1759528 RepID=A0ABS3FS06_9CYAN|nr:class I SAM-dependent methyltransferase [Phormidium pseudopriestleyi]MBO0349900.1 class I SAM-dependent methyltransferase [Phormidium pseudopriestleyi FRX01]